MDSSAWTISGGSFKSEAREIFLHVLGVGSAGQRQHPNRAREAEHHLRRSCVQPRRERNQRGMPQHFRIRGEQRESLISNLALVAELHVLRDPIRVGQSSGSGRRQGVPSERPPFAPGVAARHCSRRADAFVRRHALFASPPTLRRLHPSSRNRRTARATRSCQRGRCPDVRANWLKIARPEPRGAPRDRRAADGPDHAGR